jgi:hypothetical protein
MTWITRILALYLTIAAPVLAQTPPGNLTAGGGGAAAIDYEAVRQEKVVTAIRITEPITLDGYLEEPGWKLAVPATDFVQWSPRNGEPATEPTEVRFLFDNDNLYVGFICFDSDASNVVVKELKEDYNFQDSDGVHVIIDSLHDRRSGFSFGINPAGARRDSQITNESQFNNDWDAVWDAKVSRNDEGWIAEYVIPFKTLRFSNAPTQEWGLHLSRRVLRKNEESFWSPLPIRYRMRMSMAGTLKGLENIHQGRNLKVKPFVTGGITQANQNGQLRTLQSFTRLKDYDGGFDAKYGLTPSLTLDATYRTDFAQVEVDQQQVNLTRFNLFFPEKRDFFLENAGTFGFGAPGGMVGSGNANLVPFFSRRIGLSAAGTPIPIVGGARVSGQVNNFDVGFLAMKTERQGLTPSNNYLVGRVKRNLLSNSWIGALVTNRESTAAGDYNRVYGPDAHFVFFDRLEIDSYLLRSQTPGRSGNDQAQQFGTAWRDDELTLAAEYSTVEVNFNPEVGFVRRSDLTQYNGEISWRPQLRSSDSIRNLSFGTSVEYSAGSGTGKIETRSQDVSLGIQFENNGNVNFGINQTFDRLTSSFPIRSDISIAPGDYKYLSYSASFNSGQGQRIGGNGSINIGEFWNGNRKSFSGGLNITPNHHLNVNLTYNRNRVELPNGSFTTDLVGTRISYGFSSRAFLNAFFQYNADTHQVSSNIRFNIIHHPLSDLYVVYNDRRDTDNGQLMERAFIIKLTNLFNF